MLDRIRGILTRNRVNAQRYVTVRGTSGAGKSVAISLLVHTWLTTWKLKNPQHKVAVDEIHSAREFAELVNGSGLPDPNPIGESPMTTLSIRSKGWLGVDARVFQIKETPFRPSDQVDDSRLMSRDTHHGDIEIIVMDAEVLKDESKDLTREYGYLAALRRYHLEHDMLTDLVVFLISKWDLVEKQEPMDGIAQATYQLFAGELLTPQSMISDRSPLLWSEIESAGTWAKSVLMLESYVAIKRDGENPLPPLMPVSPLEYSVSAYETLINAMMAK